MRHATQADIARRCGVAQTTVGFALNHYRNPRMRLRPETRQRILDAAHELGYRPHRAAQALRRGKSGVIGVVQFGSYLQVSVERSVAVAKALHEAGYRLLASDAAWHEEGFRTGWDAILEARAEGVVLLNPPRFDSQEDLERLLDARIPVVALSGTSQLKVPQVRSDVRQGMSDLTRHLLALGHRRLALAVAWSPKGSDEFSEWPTLERVAGFREAAAQAGLSEIEAEVVYQQTSADPLIPYERGRLAMEGILKRRERPEVVLCSNDDWAIGALTACGEVGVRVPDDIAITGFDNSTVGRFGMVPLTTVAQQPQVMAKKAVEILVGMIKGELQEPAERVFKVPCQVVVRRSCRSHSGRRSSGKVEHSKSVTGSS